MPQSVLDMRISPETTFHLIMLLHRSQMDADTTLTTAAWCVACTG